MRRKADLIAQLDSANENLNSLNKHIKDVKDETDLNQVRIKCRSCLFYVYKF